VSNEHDSSAEMPGVETNLSEKTPSFLSTEVPPTLVLLSRPDAYDRQNVVQDYLVDNKYQLFASFPAFAAWRR
jgi:hypothetical protein